jgi:hypothetical protein
MKRLVLAITLVCCSLGLAAQEDSFRVTYKGAKPTITDFAWAFLFSDQSNEEECGHEAVASIEDALKRYRAGKKQSKGVTFIVDERNGYILYEHRYEGGGHKQEMCFWNESDGKHKLFAFNNMTSFDEQPPVLTESSGIIFCRYNNATKKMTYCIPSIIEVEYLNASYELPRIGKDIILTRWNDDGTKKEQEVLKWNGHGFSQNHVHLLEQ